MMMHLLLETFRCFDAFVSGAHTFTLTVFESGVVLLHITTRLRQSHGCEQKVAEFLSFAMAFSNQDYSDVYLSLKACLGLHDDKAASGVGSENVSSYFLVTVDWDYVGRPWHDIEEGSSTS